MMNHEAMMNREIEQIMMIVQQNDELVWIEEDEEDDRDTLIIPRNRHILSEDEWESIFG